MQWNFCGHSFFFSWKGKVSKSLGQLFVRELLNNKYLENGTLSLLVQTQIIRLRGWT